MSIEEIATYFDNKADEWDTIMEPSGAKHVAVAKLADVHEGSRVLDIGCGTGIMEPACLQLGAARIVALDVSEKMIEHARQKYADIPEATLQFLCEDVLALNEDEQFDSIVMYNCYPHLLEKDALVQKIASLLVPGGRFLVAHGMGRQALNHHHGTVPANVTSDLGSAQDESMRWREAFVVDEIADTPFMYFFGGSKR